MIHPMQPAMKPQHRRIDWSAKPLLAMALAVLIQSPATRLVAQTIDTNRPGFSFTPGVVPEGMLQFESGVAYDRPDSDSHTTSLPVVELRYGLGADAEIFASGITWNDSDEGGASDSGFGDVNIGAKLALSEPGATFATALLLQVSAPVGDDAFSSDSWDPSGAFIWTFAGSTTLAGTVKFSHFDDFLQIDNSLKLPLSLGGPHSAFLEWEANLREGGDDAHWLNGGYQWLMSERIQLDVNFGVGIDDDAGDYRMGVGFARLF